MINDYLVVDDDEKLTITNLKKEINEEYITDNEQFLEKDETQVECYSLNDWKNRNLNKDIKEECDVYEDKQLVEKSETVLECIYNNEQSNIQFSDEITIKDDLVKAESDTDINFHTEKENPMVIMLKTKMKQLLEKSKDEISDTQICEPESSKPIFKELDLVNINTINPSNTATNEDIKLGSTNESSSDTTSYNCTKCDFSTLQKYDLAKHVILQHKYVKTMKFRKIIYKHKLNCRFCSYTTVSERCLKKHISKHSEGKLFSCQYCKFTSEQSLLQLKKHMKTCHPKIYFSKLFKTTYEDNMDHFVFKYKCNICFGYFGKDFNKHMMTHFVAKKIK